MRKDNYRKILSEKFRAANQLETDHLTEEDEEYLLILAEARANHAKIKAARQEARKRLAARVAAVLIVAALVSSSYLLGIKSDSKASADPDDETKVVQQGDNLIIGSGVSEEDENVGVVTKTYYDVSSIPNTMNSLFLEVDIPAYTLRKVKVTYSKKSQHIDLYYMGNNEKVIIISEDRQEDRNTVLPDLGNTRQNEVFDTLEGSKKVHDNEVVYFFCYGDVACHISIPLEDEKKIEVILDDLL